MTSRGTKKKRVIWTWEWRQLPILVHAKCVPVNGHGNQNENIAKT